MAEIRRSKDPETIKYSGPMKVDGLCDTIGDWFDRFDYDGDKVLDEEQVFQDHKQLLVRWEAEKDTSDYAALKMEVTLNVSRAEDITIKKEDGDISCSDCDAELTIEGWVETDTEGRFEGRPILYFLRYLGEHMFYRNYIDEYQTTLAEHCRNLRREANRYLNKELQV